MKKDLMIHKWYDKYLNLPLDEYNLSFDDGLYSQKEAIIKILNKFPDITIDFFVSLNIINHDINPRREYDEAPVAHEKARNGNFNSYVTIQDLIEIKDLVNIGIHGYNHIHGKLSTSLKEQTVLWEDDSKNMVLSTIDLIDSKIIKSKDIVKYCTPYNEYNDLQIALIKRDFEKYDIELDIVGPGRVDIETLKIPNDSVFKSSELLYGVKGRVFKEMNYYDAIIYKIKLLNDRINQELDKHYLERNHYELNRFLDVKSFNLSIIKELEE